MYPALTANDEYLWILSLPLTDKVEPLGRSLTIRARCNLSGVVPETLRHVSDIQKIVALTMWLQ